VQACVILNLYVIHRLSWGLLFYFENFEISLGRTVTCNLQCLSCLSNELEHKEQFVYNVIDEVIKAMEQCEEEPLVILEALKLLYNCCYR
jgi:MoaA/NifB/PqqE/SkfB family radical SAM enzyme